MPPEHTAGLPDEEEPLRPQQETEDIPGQISYEIARIHEESYGEPPEAVRTYLLDDAVLTEIDVRLMAHERTIIDAGVESDGIRTVRSNYQEAIGSNFVAVIERMTGRRVIGFLSDTHIEPTFTVEYFKLGPRQD